MNSNNQKTEAPKKYPGYNPKSLSHSQVNSYYDCPYGYYLSKVKKYPRKSNFYAEFGNLIHELFEADSVERKNNDRQMTLDSLLELYRYKFGTTKISFPNTRTKDKYYMLGQDMIKHYCADRNSTKILETEFGFTLTDICDVPVKGFIDVIYQDQDGKTIVGDYKTGNPYTKERVNGDHQLTLYNIAFENLYNKKPDGLEFSFVKTGKRMRVLRDERDTEKLIERFNDALKSIRAGEFDAVGTNRWYCENLCSMGDHCDRKHEVIDS